MKIKSLVITAYLLTTVTLLAQQKETSIVKLRGTRLTYPLVKKWIAEFSKEYPAIKVEIAPNAPADSIDFSIASYALTQKDLEGNREGVVVARYVQLPVVNSDRPGLAELQTRGFTEKNLNDLFFTTNAPDFVASSTSHTPLALYVRDRPVCAVKAFATHFGSDPKQLKGTGIKGDDQDLAEAVKNDVNGISFNNLGFIYDVKTRKISKGLAVIPLDLNENGKIDKDEQIYGTLDNVVEFIERTHNPNFVNETVNFIFNKDSKNTDAGVFLRWAFDKGQKFNHEFGFLTVNEKILKEQSEIVALTFTTGSSCEGANKLMSQRKVK